MQNEQTPFAAQATVDAYATLGNVWDKSDVGKATFVIKNEGGTNGAKYMIEGSIDGTTWATVVAEQTLAASAIGAQVVSDYWPKLRIRIKAAVAGSQTSVSAAAAAIAET